MVQETDILMRFGADIAPLQRGARQATTALDKFKSNTTRVSKQLVKMSAVAATAAAAIGTSMVKRSMASIDAQAKLATQLKTTSTSIANLSLAADLSGISMETLTTAAKAMNVKLAEAAEGSGAAAKSLEKMGLTIADLEGLTLDQKMAAVNSAISNNVEANQQAAIAADFFGSRNAAAMATLTPEVIESAADQIKKMGLNISDVDAAKIEAANDAITLAKKASTGFTQQLAIQLAPVIGAIANKFMEVRGESSLLGEMSTKVFNAIIKGAGFVGNSLRGIQVILKGLEIGFYGLKSVALIVAEAIAKVFDGVVNTAKGSINALIAGVNKLPVIEMDQLVTGESEATSKLQAWREEAVMQISEATREMHELLMQPLPSDALDDFVADVTTAANAAAEATVEARNKAVTIVPLAEDTEEDSSKNLDIQNWYSDKSLGAYSKAAGDLSELMNTNNRKQFEIGKAAAKSKAVIDTYTAAQGAYASLSSIPIVGPALGAAAAGAAIIAGMARVQSINSTSFGGGASGGASGGGASAQSTQAPPTQEQTRSIRLETLDQNSWVSGSTVNAMAEKLVELQKDGFQLVI